MSPTEALQTTLAAEHAAVYAYGVLGGRVSAGSYPDLAARLRSAYDVHVARRDLLRSVITDRDADPVAPAPTYRVDAFDRSPARLSAVARGVEVRCQEVYAQLVASTSDDLRRLALTALTDAGVRSLAFGAPSSPWPGAPELD